MAFEATKKEWCELYEAARTYHLTILTYDGAEIVNENSHDPYVEKEAFVGVLLPNYNKLDYGDRFCSGLLFSSGPRL